MTVQPYRYTGMDADGIEYVDRVRAHLEQAQADWPRLAEGGPALPTTKPRPGADAMTTSMSDCPDCDALIKKYGEPDRWCDEHWREDHPKGIRVTFEVTDVNPDLYTLLFGTDTPAPNGQTHQKPPPDVDTSAVGGGADG